MKKFFGQNQSIIKGLMVSVSIIYIYVFMEWVFFVTKPSFMSNLNLVQKIQVLLSGAAILSIPVVAGVLILHGARWLLEKFLHGVNFAWIASIIPALLAASLELILIDNFTYTIFGFGVVSTNGLWRLLYAILFGGLLIGSFQYINKNIMSSNRISLPAIYSVGVLWIISLLVLIPQINVRRTALSGSTQATTEMPNIILFGVDGVNAENMSVYGYNRDTTPKISSLAQNALIAENAFTNAANTGGALTAILTGKLPTETRVIYPPDILMGNDAYQHLPGILKQLGYETVQVTMPSFGDAYDRNIRNGFDVANFRSESTSPLLRIFDKLGGGNGFYFSAMMLQRIMDRLEHAFLIKKMENPYEIVTNPVAEISEKRRFDAMLSYLDHADRPIFLHVHMMNTHGPIFEPRKQVFSKGKEQTKSWMVDYYDDTILDFDKYANDLFKHLKKTGKLDNTIIILYSDHGMKWNPLQKVPLIIWFPDHQYTGRIQENVQLTDIAPTVLDYLGVSQPGWMRGQSLLSQELLPSRPIFSTNVNSDLVSNISGEGWSVDQSKVSPPFYQLGIVNMMVCNRWYSLNLRNPELKHGDINGSTAVCDPEDLPSPQQAKDLMLEFLKKEQYDVSGLPANIPITQTVVPLPTATPTGSPSEEPIS